MKTASTSAFPNRAGTSGEKDRRQLRTRSAKRGRNQQLRLACGHHLGVRAQDERSADMALEADSLFLWDKPLIPESQRMPRGFIGIQFGISQLPSLATPESLSGKTTPPDRPSTILVTRLVGVQTRHEVCDGRPSLDKLLIRDIWKKVPFA